MTPLNPHESNICSGHGDGSKVRFFWHCFCCLEGKTETQAEYLELERKADYTLDFRGTLTPITLLKAAQLMKEMRARETMEILGCDLDTLADLFKVLPASCYEVMAMEAGEEGGTLYRLQLKKIKDS